ncbi:serine hydrolase-like protein 2 [Leguminivora glycinivorella]|uniref:serine hydrolase-like protein 2 n=1 Tax=Leguminivora glycinivorella TaxID=1035111 RepID=UPI00200D4558|nr:serine hydrolase-like protein 2 [Leguminivora glycinivorella]
MLDSEKEWFIEAPWGKICVVAWGSCFNPPILLVHGAVDSAASFRPILERLPDRFYYIAMELPGNAHSDWFPPGVMMSVHDLAYSMEVVRRHFRWKTFGFMGHSLGTLIVCYSQVYTTYHYYFTRYYQKYHIYNSPKENAPKYTREKALSMLEYNRGLTGAVASMVLERISEPVGDGLVRYIYDQRAKTVIFPPNSPEHLQKLYVNIKTPTLTIVATESIERGAYKLTPFALDETCYPNNNYRVVTVEGKHDVHVMHPERLAAFVELFLLYGVEGLDRKAKL